MKGRFELKFKRSYLLIGLIALFVFIQLIPVDRENPSSNPESELKAPQEVMTLLKNSCYDCHSNQTNWPIYSYIAPVSWLVARDVKKGRHDLNFSEWGKLSSEKKYKVRKEMVEETSEGNMPLPIYLLMHSEAELSDEQKMKLNEWADSTID